MHGNEKVPQNFCPPPGLINGIFFRGPDWAWPQNFSEALDWPHFSDESIIMNAVIRNNSFQFFHFMKILRIA